MEDQLLFEVCKFCRKVLSLRESCRGKDDEVLTNSYIVKYCSFCGQHPTTEIARLDSDQSRLNE
jgi:hypothetical protein